MTTIGPCGKLFLPIVLSIERGNTLELDSHNRAFNRNALSQAEAALTTTVRLLKESGVERMRGGFLCVLRRSAIGISTVFHKKIGKLPRAKVNRCRDLSIEKPLRLSRILGDSLSWQSRSPDRDQFGGAVCCTAEDALWLCSFSGLTEEADECLALIWLIRMRMLTVERAYALARISNNQLFFRATVGDLCFSAA